MRKLSGRRAWRRWALAAAVLALPGLAGAAPGLPPLPAGVAELRFDAFFRLPAGRRGLEPNPRLLELAGQRVRVLGYVVAQEQPTPGLFMLTARPVALAEQADGPADDLPPATLYVHLAPAEAQRVLAQPGLMVVTGRLALGNRQEANGRVSFARLYLDAPLADAAAERGR